MYRTMLSKNHPECGENEVYVTNADINKPLEWQVGWKTARWGKVAYDTNKRAMPEEWKLAPVFVKESELIENGFVWDEATEAYYV